MKNSHEKWVWVDEVYEKITHKKRDKYQGFELIEN